MMSPKKHIQLLCKADIILIILLALAGIAVTVWIYLPKNSTATHLEVRQDGRIILTLPLDTDTEQTITTENGAVNKFQIKAMTVRMQEANCGDHTCISTGSISCAGESIVCLPHRLVLQITSSGGSKDAVPDAIVH